MVDFQPPWYVYPMYIQPLKKNPDKKNIAIRIILTHYRYDIDSVMDGATEGKERLSWVGW